MKTNIRSVSTFLVLAIASLIYLGGISLTHAATQDGVASAETIAKIHSEGSARVIVKLRTSRAYRNELGMTRAGMQRQRSDIASSQRRIRDHMRGTSHTVRREFKTMPYVAMEIDAAGLARLQATSDVESVHIDRLLKPTLAESVPQIEGDLALQVGLDGAGSAIVIVDSGVDGGHSFLSGKVVHQACFAVNDDGVTGACPDGQASQIGNGAGVPCTYDPLSCFHGTHVAGIAAGSGPTFSGVAPGADLIPIQVFHPSFLCGGATPCALAWTSDIAAALEHVYEIRDQFTIAAVNMSLGGGLYNGECDFDFPELVDVIANLRTAGIPTIISSGNGGSVDAISSPACISTAISVSAVDGNDNVAAFSDVGDELDLFAPGTEVVSSIPGGTFSSFDGTSMAAPHVSGVWAVLQQVDPAATVDENLAFLEITGRPVTDNRGPAGITRSRVRLGAAAGFQNPLPVLTSVAPLTVRAWGPATTLTITGSDFTRSSVVLANGAAVQTNFISDTELAAVLSANNLKISVPFLDITVFSPPLGGGTSAVISLNVLLPSLAISATDVQRGEPISVTLTNAPGQALDWLAIAAVGAVNEVYLDWIYVGGGVTTFNWTTNAPSTTGNFEFRLFSNDTTELIASSPTFTVQSPVPIVTSVAPSTLPANVPDRTVTVSGADFFTSSKVQVNGVARATTFLSSSSLRATIPASDLATAATSLDISVFTPPLGGGTSNSVPLTIAHPVLNLSSTSVGLGGTVTVTLQGGLGHASDWLALASVGAADSVYHDWTYVAAGATTATWEVTMPSTAGDYEVRLFENSGFTRLATSAVITVEDTPAPPPPPPPPPPATATIDVSETTVGTGATVVVTLSDGPGNASDWLALARVGDPNSLYAAWIYVPSGATTTTWTVTMPATAGDYEVRLFKNNGFTLLATSPVITVDDTPAEPPPPPPPPPATATIDVSETAVGTGELVVVTLNDGPGNASDWLALARVGDSNSLYAAWIYVPPGATTTTWTVTMPSTAGDYEVRLFKNNGFTLLATSPVITVDDTPAEPPPPPPPPATASIDVSETTVGTGATVVVTMNDGPGNASDWLALAGVGDPDSLYVDWIYVPPGATTTTWTVTMSSTPGDYEVRLFANGGFTRLATSPIITVEDAAPPPPPPPPPPPATTTIDVSANAVSTGTTVIATMSNGPGNAFDWFALAAVGAPASSYVNWAYVPSGATAATWPVSMPGTPGNYEIRLFKNNGFTLLATSETIVVSP